MADDDASDKTEDPTQKRLQDAHEKGDVAKSQEINTWFLIAGGTLVLSSFSMSIGSDLQAPLRNLIANSWMIPVDGRSLIQLSSKLGYALLAALGVPLLLLMLSATIGNLIQHRPVWSAENMKPKFSKLSPLAGAKRIFGKQAGVNFLKGIFKIILLGAVMVAILYPQRDRLESLVRIDPAMILPTSIGLAMKVLSAAVALLAAIGRRSAYQGANPAVADGADAQAHDGRGSAGLRCHHQPDPLCGGAEIRKRNAGAGLRRQGRRRDRPENPRSGPEKRCSHRRKRPPGAGAPCHSRDRRRNSG
jgi:FlhB HrpN YscU SpaS Family